MAFTEISLVLFLCLLGPCRGAGTPTPSGDGWVRNTVTQEFFNNIINQAGNGCTGKKFYTRNSFIAAADSFPDFTTSVTKREIAAMFAHFTHETGHFCYIKRRYRQSRPYCNHPAEQIDCITPPPGKGYCKHPENYPDCASPPAGKGYFGGGQSLRSAYRRFPPRRPYCNHPAEQRDCIPPPEGKGYFRLGQSFSLHFLRQSELVASNPTVTFQTGLRLWIKNVRPVLNQGFGATIRAISGMECNGGNSRAVDARIGYYRAYCGKLGVDPGPNLSC
ncbi:PREDICTED: endochitinase At2g43590-like [Camelina sativa]|uniref:Endochitinase At2g43590-like n=1 Tax=Camelina sativa TaxID=90675 RepID=A0ABM0TGS1_CAMSA|nr:PREDICTED: endochitinase At2g43590-like [Camelina sativa]